MGRSRLGSGEKTRFERTGGKAPAGESKQESAWLRSWRRRLCGELKARVGERRCDVDKRCGFRVARAEAGASKGEQHLSRGLSAIEFKAAE